MHTALALSLLAAFELVSADKNVTIDDSDTSLITYNDKVLGEASICAFTEDGNLVASQPGCYNVQPSNCTTGATVGRGTGAGVTSFKFHGSAIYINALLIDWSSMYNITLDGVTESVDGVRASRAFGCFPLWSKSGLDAQKEHEISVITGGMSPNINQSSPMGQDWTDDSATFFLDYFLVTVPDDADGINGTSPSATESGPSPSGSADASESSEDDKDSAVLLSAVWTAAASVAASLASLLL